MYLRNAPGDTGTRGGGEGKTFPPPSNRKARVGRPRWGQAPLLPQAGSQARAGRVAGVEAGEEDPRGFLVSRAPPDVRKANNRGNAEKQKAIRHDLNRLCRVVPAERTSGRGQEAPGPCRLPAPRQLQAAREEEDELGAGGATLADPARGSRASARGLNERAGERARDSSCRRRRSKAAPTGTRRAATMRRRVRGPPGGRPRNGSSVGKRRQVAFGSSSLRKEVGNEPSEQGSYPALRKRH
ncbi:translation initiation factor IF-2 [Kogia breviceps]|uniref:translation initiation factor IF-2 n=1 Tax=Kogia breviceps TaxID=27615 RepID=UPI0034D36B2A